MAKKPKAFGTLTTGEMALVMAKRIEEGAERNNFIFRCICEAYKPKKVYLQFQKSLNGAAPCGSQGGISLHLQPESYQWMQRFVKQTFKELVAKGGKDYLRILYPYCGSGCTLAIRFGRGWGSLFDH